MSTENTQTDATSSGDSAASVSTEQSQSTQANDSSAPVSSFDALKAASKEAQGKFIPKDALAPAASIPPAFTPNYKYKAALQEKEVDPFFHSLIKDADSEKRVKDFLSKVDGFDFVKGSRDKIQEQFESLQSDYQAKDQVIQKVESSLQKGDLSSVFRQLGVTQESIFRWTQEQLQRMEMPPEQRKAFEDAENMRSQQEQMQEQMTQYQRMYEQQSVQARTMQLDFVLSRPEISQAAQNWDNIQGHAGAFRDLIIQEAQAAYYQQNVDLSAEQAAQRVMQKFGKVMTMSGNQSAPQAQEMISSQTPQASMPQAKPVIPNAQGKGTTPIKKVPKSLDDLKRLAKEAQALENQIN